MVSWQLFSLSGFFSLNPQQLVAYKIKNFYPGIIEASGVIIKHKWNSASPLHVQPCHVHNPGLFRTRGIFKSLSNLSDDQEYSEPWYKNSLFKHFQ